MAAVDADGSQVVPYLNRLSDLCWTLARWQEGVCADQPRRPRLHRLPRQLASAPCRLAVHLADSIPPQATADRRCPSSPTGWTRAGDRPGPVEAGRLRGQGRADLRAVGPDRRRADAGPGRAWRGRAICSTTALRRAAAAFGRAVRRHNAAALRLDPLAAGPTARPRPGRRRAGRSPRACSSGVYEYLRAQVQARRPPPSAPSWSPGPAAGAEAGLERGTAVARRSRWARDLVNEPGGSLTPASLAKAAVELGRGGRAVGQGPRPQGHPGHGPGRPARRRTAGSARPPRFIELRWQPPGERAGPAGAGRQGHHVRLRRAVAEERRPG